MSNHAPADGAPSHGAGHHDSAHHVVITADSHCGAAVRDYKPYLEKKYHADFDTWADYVEAEQAKLTAMFEGSGRSPLNVGVNGDPELDADRNFSTERRLREQEADGVIAAVLFPNTQPPFAPPTATQFEAPPVGDDFEHRWAGLRAHNRWLVDFVSEAPERRAGIAQIFLGNVEGSVAEIEWARENGLRGGVLLPGAPPGSGLEPLYSAAYEPIWAAAAANAMPVNHHSGGATPDYGNHFPASLAMFMLEVTWWSQRAVWHLLFSGVFERHPALRFINTESGTAWVLDTLDKLDSFYTRMKYGKFGSEAIFGGMAVAELTMLPSEYWRRNCYVGASFLRPTEVGLRHAVGIDNIAWGSDYPHTESSYPYTRQHLRLTFGGVDPADTEKMLTTNVARLYDFDVEALRPLAEQHCPTKAEIAEPIEYTEIPEEAQKCPGLAPQNQVQVVS